MISYPPYGYANVDGEMVIVPEQAEVVKEIFAGCLAGKSTHIIAKELNEKGVPTKRGAKWTGATINGILTNEKYIGAVVTKDTEQEMLKKRIEEMRQFLQTQSSRVTEYDEQMVRNRLDIFRLMELVIHGR